MLLKGLVTSAMLWATLGSMPSVSAMPQSPAVSAPSLSAPASATPLSSAASSAAPSASSVANSTSSGSNSTSTNSTTSGSGKGNFVIYTDMSVQGVLPDPSDVEGFNVVALSFLLAKGPADQAQAWAQLDNSTRASTLSKYKAAGIKVIVSAFGSTETPTTSGEDPTQVANMMASWVKQYGLDGIDVDYEDETAMNKGDNSAEQWLETFTKTLRSQLPQGQYILTHAPLAPWLSKSPSYKSGAYLAVDKSVGSMIDWYNIQFYNQDDYENCDSLITKSSSQWPQSSITELMAAGIAQEKLVIGKPATQKDASNGYIDPGTLAGCVSQAKQKGWSAGVMVWEYPNANSAWIKQVRGQAFPMSS